MSNVDKSTDNPSLLTKIRAAADDYLYPKTDSPIALNTKYKEDLSKTMKATEWHGAEDVRVVERPAPAVTEPADAIVRITSATICGSDLHMSDTECTLRLYAVVACRGSSGMWC